MPHDFEDPLLCLRQLGRVHTEVVRLARRRLLTKHWSLALRQPEIVPRLLDYMVDGRTDSMFVLAAVEVCKDEVQTRRLQVCTRLAVALLDRRADEARPVPCRMTP